VRGKVHSHNSNCIYSVAKSNGDSIEFSLSIAEQRAVGFILAWSLAFLHSTSCNCVLVIDKHTEYILVWFSRRPSCWEIKPML